MKKKVIILLIVIGVFFISIVACSKDNSLISEYEMKEKILKNMDAGIIVPEDQEVFDFAVQLTDHLRSTDPQLRDEMIMALFYSGGIYKELNNNEISKITERLMDDDHLFYKIDQEDEDAVFNRSFSLLTIDSIVRYCNANDAEILSQKKLQKIISRVIDYGEKESDLRGFVEGKGYAHSVAHLGDTIKDLSRHMTDEDIEKSIKLIFTKVNVNNYMYVNGEGGRLAEAVAAMMKNNLIDDDTVAAYLNDMPIDKNNPVLVNNQNQFLMNLKSMVNDKKKFPKTQDYIDMNGI